MPRSLYCWRCKMDIPMLDEHEWMSLPALADRSRRIADHRRNGLSLSQAVDAQQQEALEQYHVLTGFHETNFLALLHHRISLYGPPCRRCGKALRTAVARRCRGMRR